MPPKSTMAARPALQDARSRVNQTPIPPPSFPKASGQPLIVEAAKTTSKSTNSKKRKSETSLDDDIAAYKHDLDIDVNGMQINMTCNQVRGKINKLLDNGIMKKGEFCKAIGSNINTVNTFLAKRGSMDGIGSSVYDNAWGWFKQRELAGLKMPDVKKRQKIEAAAATDASVSSVGAGPKGPGKAAAALAPNPDFSNINLPKEETDSVPIYDSCDEVRKKISAHLQTPGLTAAQLCRDVYAQLNQPSCKSFQSKQLNDFRGKRGASAGSSSQIYYAAYVFFEKKRIAEGKPKSQHRLKMEEIWAIDGGIDRDQGRHGVWVMAGESVSEDQYGQLHFGSGRR
ncbi:hypothetical protein F4804DRAFT_65025 [Jackrogersella minutella]|nr:hypothetical protein F4804DRAFT_65025 [Jackrogersella minutella]